jgi:hypothetical protein
MGLALFLIVIVVFTALLFRFRRSEAIFALAAAAWAGAFAWNVWVLQSCSGDCNIRPDLALIAPVVLIATGFALSEAIRRKRGSC